MSAVEGVPFSGGKFTDLCQAPGSGNASGGGDGSGGDGSHSMDTAGTATNVSCNRPHTTFPDSPWYEDGWACRFYPCKACADYGDHDKCVHGELDSPLFEKAWSHPDEAAVHVLHDGSWGGWGFNVAEKKDTLLHFRDGGFQEQTGTDCNGKGTSMIVETHRCIFFILNSVCYQWRCVCKPANVPRAPVCDRRVQLSDAAHLRRFISKAGHATAFLLRMCLKSLTCQGSLSLLAAGSF